MTSESPVPNSQEAEKAVLGAALLSPAAIVEALEFITADDFYHPSHRLIFDHITKLYSEGSPCDVVTVAHSLDASGDLNRIGGSQKLIELQARTPVISHAAKYAKIIKDTSVFRKLISVADDIREVGFSGFDSAEEAIAEAERLFFKVADLERSDDAVLVGDGMSDFLTDVSEQWSNGRTIAGISTGLPSIDKMLSGLRRTRLIVLGARPSMGKSAMATNMAAHVAINEGLPVVIFSLEMSTSEIIQRLVCSLANVTMDSLTEGVLTNSDWTRIVEAMAKLSVAPLVIDPDTSLTPLEMHSRARKVKSKYGDLGLVVIDYIQLMATSGFETRQQEVSNISRHGKLMAKDLDVPVLALSQLSRNLESRNDKRPMLSDLRESGAIEQDADVVAFLYRDEVYNPQSEYKGFAEFIVAKQRQGATGKTKLAYVGPLTKFAEIATSMREPSVAPLTAP